MKDFISITIPDSVTSIGEGAVLIVRRIYQSVIQGKGVQQIADKLTAENVLTPSAHWRKIGAGMKKTQNANPCKWSASAVINILKKEEYMGWKVLNKTIKENYKSKKRTPANPEDKIIFKNAHPQIIDEEMWNVVQRLRETKRCKQRVGGEPNPLTGIMYCADCGKKMYNKVGKADKSHDRKRYAEKRNARLVAEQTIRAEILQDTPYAV
jgi:hypothetical protein